MDREWLIAEYSAGSGYLSTLIQVRFTVAGFYVAFLGFLATITPSEPIAYVFGIAVTILVMVMEFRTTQLLDHAFNHLAALEAFVKKGETTVDTEKTAVAEKKKVDPLTFFSKLPDARLLSHKLALYPIYFLGGTWMAWKLFPHLAIFF